jgi:hypothetical protein
MAGSLHAPGNARLLHAVFIRGFRGFDPPYHLGHIQGPDNCGPGGDSWLLLMTDS